LLTDHEDGTGRRGKSSGHKIPFVLWVSVWGLGLVIALVSIGADVLVPGANRIIGRDFVNLWTAGHLVRSGQAQCVYDVHCFRSAIHEVLGLVTSQNYSYPPQALLLAAPLAVLPYYMALAAWTLGGIAFFSWCAKPYLPKGFRTYLAALTPAAAINTWSGQFGFLLGGLWLLCFRMIDQRPKRSGVLAGLLTFKPHLGIMIAVTLIRDRRAVAAALLTTLALVILSVAAFGLEPWTRFLFDTTRQQQTILTSPNPTFYFQMMPSAYVAYGKGAIGIVTQVFFGGAAVILLARSGRWDAFSASTATVLLVPYVFNYDMTVANLGFATILYGRWSELTWYDRSVFILAFLSPELTYFADFLAPPALLGALILQLRHSGRNTTVLDGAHSVFVAPETFAARPLPSSR
jgi:hypothetical protein